MNKSLIKDSAFTMKRAFTKMVFALCFAFLFVGLGEMNAQTDNTSRQKLATKLNVEVLAPGSVDYDNALSVLENQLDTATKSESATIEHRYYWLVSVDVNRFNVPLEEALINNLMKVQGEFNATLEDIQTLYQSTVDML